LHIYFISFVFVFLFTCTATTDIYTLSLHDALPISMNSSGTLGTRYEALFLPHNPNEYDAVSNTAALYISNEFSPAQNLKAIVGLRAEKYDQVYTGRNQQGLVLKNQKVLDDLDL